MFVFVSDIHLNDGTAVDNGIKKQFFDRFFSDVARYSRKYKTHKINIVLLGDIFDFLRTEYWIHVPMEERPWSNSDNYESLDAHFNRILDKIIEVNQDILELFKSRLRIKYGFWTNPTLTYIPGNHDKFVNNFVSLRTRIHKLLNLPGKVKELFPDTLYDEEAMVYATHGHKWDDFNYAIASTEKNKLGISIGDLITTEMVVKIQHLVLKRLMESGYSEIEAKELKALINGIVFVRPLSAVPKWLEHKTMEDRRLFEILSQVFNQVSMEFKEIDLVKNLLEQAKEYKFSFNTSRKLNAALFLLRKANYSTFSKGATLYEKTVKNAVDIGADISPIIDFCRRNQQIRYYVQGHTHKANQIPIHLDKNPLNNQIYLNTGTWQALNQYYKSTETFMKLNTNTYTMIFTPDEVQSKSSTFEVWHGIS